MDFVKEIDQGKGGMDRLTLAYYVFEYQVWHIMVNITLNAEVILNKNPLF